MAGVSWLMHKQVVELLACWSRGVGWHQTKFFLGGGLLFSL